MIHNKLFIKGIKGLLTEICIPNNNNKDIYIIYIIKTNLRISFEIESKKISN